MGMLRGIAKAFGGLVFSVALTLAIVSIGMAEFTSRGNVVSLFTGLVGPQIASSVRGDPDTFNATQAAEAVAFACEGKESIDGPAVDIGTFGGSGNLKMSLSCAELAAAAANSTDVPATVGMMAARSMAEGLYAATYSCEFLDCVQDGKLLVVFSAQGNAFFRSVRLTLLSVAAVGAAVIVAACESWPERMKAIGLQLVLVGVSYFIILLGKSYVPSLLPADTRAGLAAAGVDIGGIVGRAVDPMNTMLLAAFVAGIVLVVLGYLLEKRENPDARTQLRAQPQKKQ
jgi:hypothetical protein